MYLFNFMCLLIFYIRFWVNRSMKTAAPINMTFVRNVDVCDLN